MGDDDQGRRRRIFRYRPASRLFWFQWNRICRDTVLFSGGFSAPCRPSKHSYLGSFGSVRHRLRVFATSTITVFAAMEYRHTAGPWKVTEFDAVLCRCAWSEAVKRKPGECSALESRFHIEC